MTSRAAACAARHTSASPELVREQLGDELKVAPAQVVRHSARP